MKRGGRNASRPRPPHDWFDAIAITRTTVWTYPRCNAAKLA
jgi:hypothetical protein